MKITSINFVKRSEVPVVTRRTENAEMAQAILAKLKGAPKDQALKVEVNGAKKYTAYAIRRALVRAGAKTIQVSQRENFIYVSWGE